MRIEEVNIDLFEFYDKNNQYVLAQCISADFAMGRGIAPKFNTKFNVKKIVDSNYIPYWMKTGYCLSVLQFAPILNLVTKQNYFDKPTYKSIQEALLDMKNIIIENNIKYLAMPRIGSGLDKLVWEKVYKIIVEVFEDIDIDIKVCYL